MRCKLCGQETGIPELPENMKFTFCAIMRNRHHKITGCIREGEKFRWCADCPRLLAVNELRDLKGRKIT